MFISLEAISWLILFRWRADFQFFCRVTCSFSQLLNPIVIRSRFLQVAFSTFLLAPSLLPSITSSKVLMLYIVCTHGCYVLCTEPSEAHPIPISNLTYGCTPTPLLSRAQWSFPKFRKIPSSLLDVANGNRWYGMFVTLVYHCWNKTPSCLITDDHQTLINPTKIKLH
ncbi:hypothetical protein F5146DRAFT_546753 [Armillaria mellea]|nr:hypothetical protein F5146DRAFT_546753 [Armillaria mellea]